MVRMAKLPRTIAPLEKVIAIAKSATDARQAAQTLNRLGYVTPGGGQWRAASVVTRLRAAHESVQRSCFGGVGLPEVK